MLKLFDLKSCDMAECVTRTLSSWHVKVQNFALSFIVTEIKKKKL